MQAIQQLANGLSNGVKEHTNGTSSSSSLKNGLKSKMNGSLLPSTSTLQSQLAADLLESHSNGVELTGYDLTIGKVVAAARKGKEVRLGEAEEIRTRIDESVAFLQSK